MFRFQKSIVAFSQNYLAGHITGKGPQYHLFLGIFPRNIVIQRLVAELKPRQVCSMVMSCQMEEQRKQKEFNGFDEIPGKGDQIESDQLETIHAEKNNKTQRTHF